MIIVDETFKLSFFNMVITNWNFILLKFTENVKLLCNSFDKKITFQLFEIFSLCNKNTKLIIKKISLKLVINLYYVYIFDIKFCVLK